MVQSRSLGGEVDALVRALRSFEPREYSGEDCAKLVKTFTRAEKALATARTLTAARAAECNEHRKEGFADPSEWLSRHAGTTPRDGRRDRPHRSRGTRLRGRAVAPGQDLGTFEGAR